MKAKILAIAAIAAASTLCASAQQKGSYINLNAGGGLHSLLYDPDGASESYRAGFTVNLGYSYFWNKHWGFGIGANLSSYNSKCKFNQESNTSAAAIDNDGEGYTRYTNVKENGASEVQHVWTIGIPVSLQFQTAISQNWTFLAGAGAKIAFPCIKEKYEGTDGSKDYNYGGYYASTNLTINPGELQADGFESKSEHMYTNDDDIDNFKDYWISGFANIGFLRRLSEHTELYLGLYGDYDFTDAIDSKDADLNFSSENAYQGVLESNRVDHAHALAVGGVIGLRWRICCGAKAAPAPVEVLPEKKDTVVKEQPKPVKKDTVVKKEEPKAQPVKKEEPKESNYDKAKKYDGMVFHFKTAQSKPYDTDEKKVNELSSLMKSDSSIKMEIVGHTDNIGSHESNVKYGEKRAENAKKIFTGKGVKASQISTSSKSYDEPVDTNNTEAGRQHNRRAVVHIK